MTSLSEANSSITRTAQQPIQQTDSEMVKQLTTQQTIIGQTTLLAVPVLVVRASAASLPGSGAGLVRPPVMQWKDPFSP